MAYTLKEIKAKVLKKENCIYHRFITEPLSIPVLWILQWLPWITPNGVSWLGLLLTIVAAFFFAQGNILWGAIMYFVSYFTDSLDGKLARMRNMQSKMGIFVDSFVDLVRVPLLTGGMVLFFKDLGVSLFFLLGFIYVALVAMYDALCSKTVVLNQGKQLMTALEEEKRGGFLLSMKKTLKAWRLRLGYTTAETNAVVFLVAPLLAVLTGKVDHLVYGFMIGIGMLTLLFSAVLILQYKKLRREEKHDRA